MSIMASLVIPATLEKKLALGDGSTEDGCPVATALQLDQNEVANLYTISGGEFKFVFQEHGVAYDESEATNFKIEVSLSIQGYQQPSFSMKVDPSPVQMWGLNFAGRVLVSHESGEERVIYLPGTRTYDPAGLTGDPHASERIGPSCSRTQIGICTAELMAALKGAELKQINCMHEQTRVVIRRYHGREVLFDWMKLQVKEAVYGKANVTPYPEYIKALVKSKEFELTGAREHTKAYLDSYEQGLAHPPVHYYRKVAKKDRVEDILSREDVTIFKKIIE